MMEKLYKKLGERAFLFIETSKPAVELIANGETGEAELPELSEEEYEEVFRSLGFSDVRVVKNGDELVIEAGPMTFRGRRVVDLGLAYYKGRVVKSGGLRLLPPASRG